MVILVFYNLTNDQVYNSQEKNERLILMNKSELSPSPSTTLSTTSSSSLDTVNDTLVKLPAEYIYKSQDAVNYYWILIINLVISIMILMSIILKRNRNRYIYIYNKRKRKELERKRDIIITTYLLPPSPIPKKPILKLSCVI